jgi:PAS domain S-box-containing protein
MSPFLLSVAILCLIGLSVPIAIHLLRSKTIPGLRVLGVCVLTLTAWAIGLFKEITADSLTIRFVFFYQKEIAYGLAMPLFFSFVRQFSRQTALWARILEGVAYLYPPFLYYHLWHNIDHNHLFELLQTPSGFKIEPYARYYLVRSIPIVFDGIAVVMLILHYRLSLQHLRFQTGVMILLSLFVISGEALTTFGGMENGWMVIALILAGVGFIAAYVKYGVLSALPIGRDSIIEAMQIGILVIDRQNRLVEINTQASIILRIYAPEYLGEPAEKWLAKKLHISTLHLIQPQNQPNIEICIDEKWYSVNVKIIHDHQNNDIGRIITLTDITDSIRIIKELQVQQQRWAFHLSQTPLAYIEWDKFGNIAEWNATSEALFGYEKPEVLGKQALTPLSDEIKVARTVFDELLQVVVKHRTSVNAISPVITKNGKELYCDWYITPLLDVNGALDGIAALGVDVTEGQKAIANVLGMNQELESIFKALPDIFIRLNTDGEILDYKVPSNDPVYSAKHFNHAHQIQTAFPEKVAERLLQTIHAAIERKEILSLEYDLTPNGKKYYYEARIVAVDDRQAIALIRNITERVEHTEKLQHNNEILSKYSSNLSIIQKIGTENIARYSRQYEPLFVDYLEAGKRIFHMQSGIITRVVEDKVWIFAVSSDELLEMGMRFDINDTFESLLRHLNKPFYFTEGKGLHMLELSKEVLTFIGTPIFINGQYFGSLSFFSHYTRKEPFESYEVEIIELMAKLIGIFISLQKEEQFRQNAERELYANQERYKGLIESQHDFIIRTDPFYRITFANQAFCENFGMDRQDIERRNLFSIIKIKDQKSFADQTAFLSEPPFRFAIEVEIETLKGWQWFSYESVAIRNESGELVEIQSVGRDIHERILMEVALRDNEARFRNLAANSPDYIFIFDIINNTDVRLHYLNRPDYLGYPLAEVKQSTFWENYLHPDDVDKALQAWHTMISTETNVTNQFRFKNKNGEWEWIQSRQRILEKDAEGNIRQVLVTNSVITERQKAEQQIVFQASMLNQVNSGVVANDLHGRIIYWNKSAEEMFQFSSEEVIGHKFVDLVVPDQLRKEYYGAMIEFETQSYYNLEFELQRKDGTRFPIWSSLTWVKDQQGNRVAAVGIIVDQTERKRAEQELINAIAAAETATNEKSNFLAVMSHEIRTPMNTVIGFADLLAETNLNDEQIDYVSTIRNSGMNLLALINNILDFSKIEQGKMELALQPMNLNQVMEETMSQFYAEVRNKGLEMMLFAPPNIPQTLIGDETRFKQVLTNLLGNAVKFTKEGFVALTVAWAQQSAQHLTLRFSVKDTGIGIPPEKMDRLFKPFSQADRFTTRKYGGTGLGLVICDRLVHMMGGNIYVESEPDHGTTFHFSIQFGIVANSPKSDFESLNLTNYKTLYLDSNPATIEVYAQQFRQWGLQVVAVPHMKEAFIRLRIEPDISLLITNHIDPYARPFLKRIRQTYPDVKILFLKDGNPQQLSRPDEALFDLSLVKPAKLSQLYQQIGQLLGAKAVTASAKTATTSVLDPQLAERFPLNILVAEDHPVNQKMIELVLSKMGYTATIVENGVEAVEAVEREDFDLIFMDMQMPFMDGIEATRYIKSQERFAQTPIIIAMTANAMNEDKENCFQAGMRDFISKPIKLEYVRTVIEQYGAEIHTRHMT